MKKLFLLVFIGLLLVGCNSNLEVQSEDTQEDTQNEDFHTNVDRSAYENVEIINLYNPEYLDAKVAVNGVLSDAYGLLQDSYDNITFIVNDGKESLDGFWYNTDNKKTTFLFRELKKAIEENKAVIVYGEYQENPNQVGRYNLFVHDIDILGSTYNYNTDYDYIESDTPTNDIETETETAIIEVPNYCSRIAREVVGKTKDGEDIYLFPEDNGLNGVTLNDGTHKIPEIWYKFDVLMSDLSCIRKKVSGQQLKLDGADLTEKDWGELGNVDLTAEDYDIVLEGFSFISKEFKKIGKNNPDLTEAANYYVKGTELSSEVVKKYLTSNEFDSTKWNNASFEMSMGWNEFRPLVIESGVNQYFNY